MVQALRWMWCHILLLKHFHQQQLCCLSLTWISLTGLCMWTRTNAGPLNRAQNVPWPGQGTQATSCWPSLSSTKKIKRVTESSLTYLSILTTTTVFFPDGKEKRAAPKKVGRHRDLMRPSTVRVLWTHRQATQAASGSTRDVFGQR